MEYAINNIFWALITIIFCYIYSFIERDFCRNLVRKPQHLCDGNREREDICLEHCLYIKLWGKFDNDTYNLFLVFDNQFLHWFKIVCIDFKVEYSFKIRNIKSLHINISINTRIQDLQEKSSSFFSWYLVHMCCKMFLYLPSNFR